MTRFKLLSRVLLLTLLAGGAGWVMACGDGDGGPSSPPDDEVATIEVTPGQAELAALGETVQLTATPRADDGTDVNVSVNWSSSSPAVASVSSTGLVTAESEGAATITAEADGVQGTAQITVDQSVASVEITPPTASISPGREIQFDAQALDANDAPVPGVTFDWASTDESVATVTQTGLATGQAEGTTMIQAGAEGVTGSATLSVTREVSSVEVTPPTADLDAVGATAQFSAEATDQNGDLIENVAFTWTSSDESVATVDETGLATAVGDGTTTISAEADQVTGSATLTVDQATASVEVTPANATTTPGSTVQFEAQALDSNGNEIADAGFTWGSSDESVATVDQSGLATGEAVGTAQITATSEGVSDSGTLTVSQTAGEINLVSGDGQNGKTQRDFSDPLVVEVLDANGDPESGVTVTWSVVEGDATVSDTQVQTDAQGRASVTLTAGTDLTNHRIEAAADGRDGSPVEFTARTTVLVAVIGDNFFEDLQGRRNQDFQVSVSVGDTIEFVHEGNVTHTATSTDEPQGGDAFDSGNMSPGDTFRFVPGVTGTWTFFCEIHPGIMLDSEIVVN